MEILQTVADFVLHIDKHLNEVISQYGTLTYAILFFIIFAETGFVVTPFLPGDSLIFAAGALAANEANGLNVHLLAILMIVAAIAGNQLNYAIGRWLGPKVYEKDYKLIRRSYLERTHKFYEKHGGKTIIYSRFIPIIRTFAPFVAGIGDMPARRFTFFNVAGAVAWVVIFLYVGFYFGNRAEVKNNFSAIIVGIIIISLIPPVLAFIKVKMEARKAKNS
jgi:membrane-associated protein